MYIDSLHQEIKTTFAEVTVGTLQLDQVHVFFLQIMILASLSHQLSTLHNNSILNQHHSYRTARFSGT